MYYMNKLDLYVSTEVNRKDFGRKLMCVCGLETVGVVSQILSVNTLHSAALLLLLHHHLEAA